MAWTQPGSFKAQHSKEAGELPPRRPLSGSCPPSRTQGWETGAGPFLPTEAGCLTEGQQGVSQQCAGAAPQVVLHEGRVLAAQPGGQQALHRQPRRAHLIRGEDEADGEHHVSQREGHRRALHAEPPGHSTAQHGSAQPCEALWEM